MKKPAHGGRAVHGFRSRSEPRSTKQKILDSNEPRQRLRFAFWYSFQACRTGPSFRNPNHPTKTAKLKKPKAMTIKKKTNKSMLNLSLETANVIHTTGSVIAIISAFIAAVAGAMTFVASVVQSQHADQKIAEANSLSAIANNSAAEANQKTEELVQQNLELSIKLESERNERLRLQNSLGPRKISPETALKLMEDLKGLGNSSIRLKIARNEEEVEKYAAQIFLILKMAGIPTTAQKTHTISSGSNTGVQAVFFNGPESEKIESIFRESGVFSRILRPKIDASNQDGFGFNTSEITAVITVFPKDHVLP
ncbi:hypothetical protein ACI2KG_00430 [Pseudomonas sp. NPDC089407]|uniref:hypothetical protein n=1 Tax=Pseudomonas sp. NPDC089407 TaxID=3364464 RepID=UPI00384C8C7D